MKGSTIHVNDKEQEGLEEETEKENRLPGFEIALAIASFLAAARLLRRVN